MNTLVYKCRLCGAIERTEFQAGNSLVLAWGACSQFTPENSPAEWNSTFGHLKLVPPLHYPHACGQLSGLRSIGVGDLIGIEYE